VTLHPLDALEVWFVTGSQHLSGAEAPALVAEHSSGIAARGRAGGDVARKRFMRETDDAK
jgi:L-arabinose isomerase